MAGKRGSKWWVLAAMCLGLAMLMIDTFVVNVALPTIGRDLDASLGLAEWTVAGYVLMVGVLPIAMGRLGDILGRRRVYLVGLAVFIAASVACGLAPSIEALIAFRILQGAGAATMMPGTLSIITQAFPAAQRGLAIGIWGGVSGLALIAGPVVGGLLVRGDDWRLIFLVNLPVGILALAMAALLVTESRDERASRRIDWPGLVLLSGGLFLVIFAFTRGNDAGWTAPVVLGSFIAGAAMLAAFVPVERRTAAPLVDLALFRNGTFVAACLAAFLFSAAVFGSQPFMSLFMQNYWDLTPLQGGLAFIPATALVAVLMPVSGIVGQRLGGRLRWLLMFASLCVLASALYLLTIDTESTYVTGLLPPFIIRGLGIGLFMSASSFAVVSAVPLAKSGLASGTLTMARQVGTAFGVAVLGTVYVQRIERTLPGDLAAAGATDAPEVLAAASHFDLAGSPASRALAEAAIVDGFIAIAVATCVFGAIAAVAATFIRHRMPAEEPAVPTPIAGPRPAAMLPTPETPPERTSEPAGTR